MTREAIEKLMDNPNKEIKKNQLQVSDLDEPPKGKELDISLHNNTIHHLKSLSSSRLYDPHPPIMNFKPRDDLETLNNTSSHQLEPRQEMIIEIEGPSYVRRSETSIRPLTPSIRQVIPKNRYSTQSIESFALP